MVDLADDFRRFAEMMRVTGIVQDWNGLPIVNIVDTDQPALLEARIRNAIHSLDAFQKDREAALIILLREPEVES